MKKLFISADLEGVSGVSSWEETRYGGPGYDAACRQLTRELYDWFKEANGKNTLCFRVLTRQFTLSPEEHAQQCVWLTGLCALKTARTIVRELGLTNLDEQPALDK